MTEIRTEGGPRDVLALRLARFRRSAAYDRLMRLPLLAWLVFCCIGMSHTMSADWATINTSEGVGILRLLAHLAGLGFAGTCAIALCIRRSAIARSSGWSPRIVAFCGSFALLLLPLFPPAQLGWLTASISLLLIVSGNLFAIYTLFHLGRSFSVMPEARRLIVTGPYAVVRHPLYVAEAVASLGFLLQYLSALAVLVWTCHIALQFGRMREEERVLIGMFPEYKEYALRVARVLPLTALSARHTALGALVPSPSGRSDLG